MQTRTNNTFFNIIVIFIMTLLAYRDLASAPMNVYMLIVIMSIPYLLFDKEQSVKYTCFLFPMMGGVIPYYLGVGLLILYIRFWPTIQKIQVIPFVILALLEGIHFFITPTTHSFVELLSYISVFGLFFLLLSLSDQEFDRRDCLNWFIWSICFEFVVLMARSYFVIGDFSALMETRALFTVEEDATNQFFSENPTTIAIYSIAVIAILLFGKGSLQMNNTLYWLSLVISITAGAMTISRTWVLCLALVLLLFVFSKKNKMILYGGIVVCLGLIYFSYFGDSQLSFLFKARMYDENMSTVGGRTDIFSFYHQQMFSNPKYLPFGVGAYCYSEVFNADSPHNAIQQIFVSYGFAGLLLFLIYSLRYSRLNRTRNAPFVYHIPFLVVFLFLQSTQFLMPCRNMIPVIMSVFFLRLFDISNNETVHIK